MDSGGVTFWQFGTSRQVGTFQQFGQIGTFQPHETGCTAVVTVENGQVTGVNNKPYGGIITGPLVCSRLFSGCR
jgi:hypothetical protein